MVDDAEEETSAPVMAALRPTVVGGGVDDGGADRAGRLGSVRVPYILSTQSWSVARPVSVFIFFAQFHRFKISL